MTVKQPTKWRETMDPFSSSLQTFELKEILGYPHAGNDVFYVRGLHIGEETFAYLKVERQATADIQREVETIQALKTFGLGFVPEIIEYSLQSPRYLLTKEAAGSRLSAILGDNEGMESMNYMGKYGRLLACLHSLEINCKPVKQRALMPSHEFFEQNSMEAVEAYLRTKEIHPTQCFIHGDCHYANLLWQDGEISCVLDYELAGYGDREYDLAWAIFLRPGQKFLKTELEREALLQAYSQVHDFDRDALDYYTVLIGSLFYKISPGDAFETYRALIASQLQRIIAGSHC